MSLHHTSEVFPIVNTEPRPTTPSLVHRVVLVLDGWFEALTVRLGLRRPTRRRPPVLLPYRGHGTTERIELTGRVVARPPMRRSRSSDSAVRNLVRMIRRFLTRELGGVTVTADLAGVTATTTTDDEGYFAVVLEGSWPPGWSTATLMADGAIPAGARVRIVPPTARVMIISDVDDTVLQSGATSVPAVIRTTLFGNAHTRSGFPGTAELYADLVAGAPGNEGNPVFFVSSSPWNLYDFLTQFMLTAGLPEGPILLRDFGVDEHKLIAGSHDEHKLARIEGLAETYPGLGIVLVGDSGQRDPEIYREVVRRHPGRVRAIYVRDIDPDRRGAVDAVTLDLATHDVPVVLSDTAAAFHAHAETIGLVAG